MLSLALLLLAAQAAPAELPTEQEIVVTGRRMSQVQIAAKINPMTGKTRCWITVPSGDPRIDRQMCEITKACAQVKPRKRPLIESCISARKEQFLRTYVAPKAPAG